jgi:hypothetical protein
MVGMSGMNPEAGELHLLLFDFVTPGLIHDYMAPPQRA